MIPAANVEDLMLREDVLEAVGAGKFHIWPVATIEEGIEILTGATAGFRNGDGTFGRGTVFAQVNDFHKWDAWSPWAKLDPNMKQNYEGAPAGTGAMYSWTGNDQVGQGRMTITDSKPSELVKIKLEFIKPWTATNATDFMFTPQGNQTSVKWTMDGDNTFMGKAFGLFMNMDKMVGGDFEKGLAQMKAVAEAAAK